MNNNISFPLHLLLRTYSNDSQTSHGTTNKGDLYSKEIKKIAIANARFDYYICLNRKKSSFKISHLSEQRDTFHNFQKHHT